MSKSKKATLYSSVLALGLTFGATTLPQTAMADGKPGSGSSPGIENTIPGGAIKIYGQTLNPSAVKTTGDIFQWKQLKHLVPELLTEKKSQNAEDLCKHINQLTALYADEADKAENHIADIFADLAKVYPDNKFFPGEELTNAISKRLSSPRKKDIQTLIDLSPKHGQQILFAQAAVKHYLTLAYLNDAAHANCPAYAKKINYSRILAPGEQYNPDSEKDAWDELEQQWNNE